MMRDRTERLMVYYKHEQQLTVQARQKESPVPENVTQLAAEKARRAEQEKNEQSRIDRRSAAEKDLELLTPFFVPDTVTGYCTVLNEQGRTRYIPAFAKYGIALTGGESFRDLQYLAEQLFDSIYDETASIAKAVREGRMKGAELSFSDAVLSGDFLAISAAAARLPNAEQPGPSQDRQPQEGSTVVEFPGKAVRGEGR